MKKAKRRLLPSSDAMEYGAGGGLGRLQKAGMLTGGAGKSKSKPKKNNPGY